MATLNSNAWKHVYLTLADSGTTTDTYRIYVNGSQDAPLRHGIGSSTMAQI